MSPTPFQQDHHNHHLHLMKQEATNNVYTGMCPSPLKIHKDSHAIKKSSSSSSSSGSNVSSLVATPPKPKATTNQQRGPVIIYTHSPKVIHTNPRDFMALVQKLTGMSRSDAQEVNPNAKNAGIRESSNVTNDRKMMMKMRCAGKNNSHRNNVSSSNDDNDTTSVITEEHCSSSATGDVMGHVNPCMVAPRFDPPSTMHQGPLIPAVPFFLDNSSNLSFYNGDRPAYENMDINFPYGQMT